MRLAARTNVAQVFDDMDDFVRAHEVAAPRALNKLRDQAKTVGLRKVDAIYRIGPRTMDRYTSLKFATAAAPQAEIVVKGRGFPLYLFQPRQTPAGVSVSVKGRRFVIPHTFIARMRSGHVGIFARGGYQGKWASDVVASGKTFGRFIYGKKRLPINELFTNSPAEAFANPEVVEEMENRVSEQALKVLGQELRFAGAA